MQEYKHTKEMGEISGFGGDYEKKCQIMLNAGVNWIANNPDKNPKASEIKNVYGIICEDNPEAEELSKAILDSVNKDCTGAMHHAVMSRCLWIKANSWDEYCKVMIESEAEEGGE